MTKSKALCITTKYRTLGELIARMHRFCDGHTLFVATHTMLAVGERRRFTLRYADLSHALQGDCVVHAAWANNDSPFGKPGLRLALEALSVESQCVFDAIIAHRREVAQRRAMSVAAESRSHGVTPTAQWIASFPLRDRTASASLLPPAGDHDATTRTRRHTPTAWPVRRPRQRRARTTMPARPGLLAAARSTSRHLAPNDSISAPATSHVIRACVRTTYGGACRPQAPRGSTAIAMARRSPLPLPAPPPCDLNAERDDAAPLGLVAVEPPQLEVALAKASTQIPVLTGFEDAKPRIRWHVVGITMLAFVLLGVFALHLY